ncbi:MAG: HPr family phosphocarrier protein [Candidatus Schekmanbacteria bacterium]|nr:HPr family phosphocarrier protein [Candidatus Schekmanbacteria bacterium]
MEKKVVKLIIRNKLGLHARAAATLVKLTNKFSSKIEIEKDGQSINGKSIMGVMMLAAAKGNSVTVTATGTDSESAISAIQELVHNKFGEE